MAIKKWLLAPFLALTFCGLPAQEWPDTVRLKNGSVFIGKILEYEPESRLRLQLKDGGMLELQPAEIQGGKDQPSLEKVRNAPSSPSEDGYHFREKGLYHATYFAALSGSSQGKFQLGLGLHHTTGYQIHRLLGIGAGLGIDTYSFEEEETLYPAFLEARGYLSEKPISPYYSGSVGYGFAFRNNDEMLEKAEGGAFFRLALGLRLGAGKWTNVLASLGYQFQQARFEKRNSSTGELEIRQLEYRRILMRIGLIF